MARHGTRRTRPGGTRARHAARDQRAHGLPGRRRRRCRRGAARPAARLRVALRARPRLPQACCGSASRGWPTALPPRRARRVIARSPTARPCWRRRWRAMPGLGWIGKHTNLLDRHDGSWFFLGEIYTDLPLPLDAPVSCTLRQLHGLHRRLPDAGDRRAVRTRRAALHLLPDDRARTARSRRNSARRSAIASTAATTASSCCPWNRYARLSGRAGFPRAPRARRAAAWSSCSRWSEDEFLRRTEGSAIRRIGYERWLRNVAVALGNAPRTAGGARGAAVRARIRARSCASTCVGAGGGAACSEGASRPAHGSQQPAAPDTAGCRSAAPCRDGRRPAPPAPRRRRGPRETRRACAPRNSRAGCPPARSTASPAASIAA